MRPILERQARGLFDLRIDLLNRRSFITGLFSACSFVMLKGGFASSEHKPWLEQRTRTQMDVGVRDGLTEGAVMIAVHQDKVLALEAAGYSNLDTKRPMRTDAIFDIRSISKPVTVFGALIQVDDESSDWTTQWPSSCLSYRESTPRGKPKRQVFRRKPRVPAGV